MNIFPVFSFIKDINLLKNHIQFFKKHNILMLTKLSISILSKMIYLKLLIN